MKATIDLMNVMRRITISVYGRELDVELKNRRQWAIRFRLGTFFVRLGARIAGMGYEQVGEGEDDE